MTRACGFAALPVVVPARAETRRASALRLASRVPLARCVLSGQHCRLGASMAAWLERDHAAEVDAPVHVLVTDIDVVELVGPCHQVIERQPTGPVQREQAVDVR